MEFGPEFRVKIETVKGVGKAEGQAWIKSRFGVGFYGSNGLQIRLVPACKLMPEFSGKSLFYDGDLFRLLVVLDDQGTGTENDRSDPG